VLVSMEGYLFSADAAGYVTRAQPGWQDWLADLAVNAPIADLHRDAARVRELLRMEPEDGDLAPVELLDNRVGVLIVVVRDDQYSGRHGSGLWLRMLREREATASRSLAVNSPGSYPARERAE